MKKLRKAYIALIMAFLYAPIVLLILYSFNDSKSRANWGGFTLRWYKELFSDAAIMSALSTTLSVGLLAAVFSTLLGTVGAIALYQMKRLPRKTLLSIVNLPMLNSEVVTGVSLMLLYAMANIQLGYLTLLLSHIAFCVPYVVLSVMPKLRQIDPNLAEAAQDLGATPMQGFFKVILPDIMPGVFSGFVMALTMSIDDFVVSFFTTGSGVSNLSITIYTMAKRGISPKINALSTIIFACVFVLLIGLNLRDFRKDGRGQSRRSRTAFLWNLQQRMLFMHDFPTPDVWLAHRVSYGETDTMGYLYYAEYLHLFERSRSEYIRQMGMSYAEVERLGIMLPVREAQCRYRRPARYDDLIHIRAGIAEVRRASLVFVYNVMDAERKTLLAEGMTEHACTGRDGRPVRPPEWFVKLMRGEPFQIPE